MKRSWFELPLPFLPLIGPRLALAVGVAVGVDNVNGVVKIII